MITHKQYPNHHIFETEIGGRTFTVETGKVAELCNAEAICRYGDTVVLVTAVASPLPKAGIDYFPLTIEVEERMYAVGRIPGSFNRREGRPSERGILISRLVDLDGQREIVDAGLRQRGRDGGDEHDGVAVAADGLGVAELGDLTGLDREGTAADVGLEDVVVGILFSGNHEKPPKNMVARGRFST